MDLETIVWCNIIGIAAVSALFGLFAGEDNVERTAFAGAAAWMLTSLSITVWVIYVAVHFVSKYW